MLACWSRECEDRPSFQTLSEELYNMQKEEQPYVNVDPSQSFILPPTAGRGIMSIKCGLHFWKIVFYTPGYTCCIVHKPFFFILFQTQSETLLLSVTGRLVGRPLITTKLKWWSSQKRRQV